MKHVKPTPIEMSINQVMADQTFCMACLEEDGRLNHIPSNCGCQYHGPRLNVLGSTLIAFRHMIEREEGER